MIWKPADVLRIVMRIVMAAKTAMEPNLCGKQMEI